MILTPFGPATGNRFRSLGLIPAIIDRSAVSSSKLFFFVFFAFLYLITPSHAFIFPRDDIMNLIPSSCTQNCQTMSTNFDTCVYGTCICTQDGGHALEDCMSCLYNLSPSPDVYNSVQQVFSLFEHTCLPANFSLAIIPNTNNSTSTVTSSEPSSESSVGASSTGSSSLPTSADQSSLLPTESASVLASVTSSPSTLRSSSLSPSSKNAPPSNTNTAQAPLHAREVCHAVPSKKTTGELGKRSSAIVRLRRRGVTGKSGTCGVWCRITNVVFSALLW